MTELHLDVETFSALDVRKVGAYRYAQHPSTEVLIACYAIGDGPVRTWLPGFKNPPPDLVAALSDGTIHVSAHNAEFERQIYRFVLRRLFPSLPAVPVQRFHCSAVRAATAGLPRSLDGALRALGTSVQKDKRGTALIRRFCSYRKPTKKDPSTRIRPQDDKPAFREFIEYCKTDVEGERTLDKVLPRLTKDEWRAYHYICTVNDRGVPIDIPSVQGATKTVAALEKQMVARVRKLTGGINPTQVAKLTQWLHAKGCMIDNMQLKEVQRRIKTEKNKVVKEVLDLRIEASRASVKKLQSMVIVTCDDGYARGTLLPYGAHTGRLSGKLIQPHNYTRGTLSPEHQIQVLDLFRTGDPALVQILLDRAMNELSQSMRGYMRAPKGSRFVIADYASIETRVSAWIAGEQKLLRIYRKNLGKPKDQQIDLYKLMATVLYGVTMDAVSKEQRRIGKNLRLGAVYQLGVDGLLKNCEKEEIEMTPEQASQAIRAYRNDSRAIVQSWYTMEEMAIDVVMGARSRIFNNKVMFEIVRKGGYKWLTMTLPSGRMLYYFDPQTKLVEKFGKVKTQVFYYGELKKGVVGRVGAYGGKWLENATQGIAYDLMMQGMYDAEQEGYPCCASIHDEIMSIKRYGEGDHKHFEKIICKPTRWGADIPLEAEGFECERYRKQ